MEYAAWSTHTFKHRLKPFMVSCATDLTSTLHDHPLDFTAANPFTAGGHNYTMSTLTSTMCTKQHTLKRQIYVNYVSQALVT